MSLERLILANKIGPGAGGCAAQGLTSWLQCPFNPFIGDAAPDTKSIP